MLYQKKNDLLFWYAERNEREGGSQNEKKELEIGDDETLLMLNRIKELNQVKFSEYLRPIILREKKRVLSIMIRIVQIIPVSVS